jgi:3-(3-hydroxy-phenyl)propionate hydroxylase
MQPEINIDYDVIIVGAGPTGVLAANLLGGYGVRTLVLDREADIVMIPRAVGMCEEGSRILGSAGLDVDCSDAFYPINNVQFVDGDLKPQFFGDMDWYRNGFRPIRMFHQPSLEREMRKSLERFPHVDLWSEVEMLHFEDGGSDVLVTVRRQGEELQLRCRYLLGCDGAKSSVRSALGIGFSGSTYPQDWVIVDIENNPIASNDVAFTIDPRRPSVTMPGPGRRRRWEFVVKKDDDVETIFEDKNLLELIAPWGDMSGIKIERKAVYTFHARTARHYQKGRVFLLGDAAHITPPFAGQGMMAGLRDAYNLCWKIAAVVQGRVGEVALASYEIERIPQSKQIINFAQFMGSIILPQKKFKASFRDAVFKLLRLFGLHSENKGLDVQKIPNHINGSLLRHALVSKFRKTGIELPQHSLDTTCGRRERSDKLMGCQFRILGWNLDPAHYLAKGTLRRWQEAGGKVSTLTSRESFETSGELHLDRSQHYRETFMSGKRVLVIRPDKMIVLNCTPQELDQKLNHYLNTLGCSRVAA